MALGMSATTLDLSLLHPILQRFAHEGRAGLLPAHLFYRRMGARIAGEVDQFQFVAAGHVPFEQGLALGIVEDEIVEEGDPETEGDDKPVQRGERQNGQPDDDGDLLRDRLRRRDRGRRGAAAATPGRGVTTERG